MGRNLGILLAVTALSVGSTTAAHTQLAGGSNWRIILEPDLSAVEPVDGPYCRVGPRAGAVVVTNIATTGTCRFRPDNREFVAPYRVEVTLRQQLGSDVDSVGISFGDRADLKRESFLLFSVTASGSVDLEWLNGGAWTGATATRPAPRPNTGMGTSNRLAVEVRGRDVSAYLNDQLVATAQPPVPLDGRVGLLLSKSGQEAIFSNFKVLALPPPTTTTNTPVVPTGGNFQLTAGGAVFVDDDLSTVERLAVETGPACWTSYRDGGFVVQSGPEGCEMEAQYLTENAIRARFEVTVRLLAGKDPGLVFGKSRRPDNLHYHFAISETGMFSLQRVQNRTSENLIPWTLSPAIRTGLGASNRLAVEVLGQEIRCFANGQYLGRAVSSEVVQGGYGFDVSTPAGRAVFTNLRVIDLNAVTSTAKEAAGTRSPTPGTGPPTRGRSDPRGPSSDSPSTKR